MTVSRPRVTIVIPFLNEERNVPVLLERLYRTLGGTGETFEVVCVDDGSRDGTVAALEAERGRRPWLRVLELDVHRGQHGAILAGFGAARGDWLVTLDADLQNPPEEIPRLLRHLREGFDLVGTYRQGRRDPFHRRCASWGVNWAVRRLVRLEIRDLGCMLRAYTRPVVDQVLSRAGDRLYLPALAALCARNPVEIPVRHEARAAGRSNYSLTGLVRLAANLFHEVRTFRGTGASAGDSAGTGQPLGAGREDLQRLQ
jgi:undecaprenyl-phosphate 4-deoxy-4-formamido-L-arabinose transferase